ncbi:hypothetical protein HETIRDRAFT_470647 [Heterobasidion irregulare TC 32-1]|uniref:Uncharacterized protein n=1 Tax=Heterobasidion irregulare (strain TC 32-1) TaxID=747525 RepID=W4KI84_HETIT|nr:uncharacterized protein HETIRDRAFT_470647 [Heterobasidion irregulare TC 32-1]ETW85573.1 hypothetical protein HETIRDRAFT_470647 [Heterobasidion irregulare TC 32-1]
MPIAGVGSIDIASSVLSDGRSRGPTLTMGIHHFIQVATATVLAGGGSPTAGTVDMEPRGSDIPIAAIAGGTAGGVLLAITAVIAWKWWGSCIKHDQEKKQKEAHAVLAVRANTRRNASSAFSTTHTQYQPALAMDAGGRKVKFAAPSSHAQKKSRRIGVQDGQNGNAADPTRPSFSKPHRRVLEKTPYVPSPRSPIVQRAVAPTAGHVSAAWPSHTAPITSAGEASQRRPLHPTPIPSTVVMPKKAAEFSPNLEQPTLLHKDSMTSSDSWYSAQSFDSWYSMQSGEEHRPAPSRRLLNWLDPMNRLSILTRSSGSMYSTTD